MVIKELERNLEPVNGLLASQIPPYDISFQ